MAGLNATYGIHEVARLVFKAQEQLLTVVCFSAFLLALAYNPIWHFREKKGSGWPSALGFFQSTLCYFVAIDLCMFAWRKIFHLQFYAPDGLLEKPISSLSGEMFTIAYFSHSYTFGVMIAAMQLAGSLLLLFRKARLLGVFILFPVVMNIILIDIFYDVEVGALIQAIVIQLGLLYLMYVERKKVIDCLFNARTEFRQSASGNLWIKQGVRISAALVPMVACLYLYDYPNRHPEITGKYEVAELSVNRKKIDLGNCADSMITRVYIDNNHDLVFERNRIGRWQVGHFAYDRSSRDMQVIWRYPKNLHDTLRATLSAKANQKMVLSGIMGRDTIKALLVQKQTFSP